MPFDELQIKVSIQVRVRPRNREIWTCLISDTSDDFKDRYRIFDINLFGIMSSYTCI